MASLEYGKYGMGFSSGCAAMSCVILSFKAGDHFLVCDDVYGIRLIL
jgi:cystathionine beta-lyase/cystathionine gamma-synthase